MRETERQRQRKTERGEKREKVSEEYRRDKQTTHGAKRGRIESVPEKKRRSGCSKNSNVSIIGEVKHKQEQEEKYERANEQDQDSST